MDNQTGMHTYPFYSRQIVNSYSKNCKKTINELKNQLKTVKKAILKYNLADETQTKMIDSLAGIQQSAYQLIVSKQYPLSIKKIQDFLLELMLNCDDLSNWQFYTELLKTDPDLAKGVRDNHVFLQDLLTAPHIQLQRLMTRITNIYEPSNLALCFKYTTTDLKNFLLKFCTKKVKTVVNKLMKTNRTPDYDEVIKIQHQIIKFVMKQIFSNQLFVQSLDNECN